MTPRQPHSNATGTGTEDPRGRLLAATAVAIEERGYANVGIADIARTARVSKRTFYEHFADREACLVALFLDVSHRTIDAMERAVRSAPQDQALHEAMTVMVRRVAAAPVLSESLLLDVPGVGGRASLERRSISERLAWLLADAADVPVRAGDHQAGLTPEIAAAIAGGVAAIILREIESGHPERIAYLADPLTGFVSRVLRCGADAR